jgi:predicted nucleic acid-binding protein
MKTLTYCDANVLIYTANETDPLKRQRALTVIGDKRREMVASKFLWLETVPPAKAWQRKKEIQYLNWFFTYRVVHWIEDERALFDAAEQLIEQHKIQLLDALHLAAAMSFNAEFVTAEKLTKPIFAAYPKAISIHFAK